MALRKNLAEVEQDAEEAFNKRRELVTLLVEKITLSRNEDGRTKVDITYRFGPPQWGRSIVRMVNLTQCAWVKHIPVDKRVAHEKALARKKWEGFASWEERRSFEAHGRTW